MKKTLILIFSLICQITWANCRLDEYPVLENSACASIDWLVGPTLNAPGQREFSRFQLDLRSLEGQLDTSNAYFYLWMKMPHHHEHGGARVLVEALGGDSFDLKEVLLRQMKGQWFIRVDMSGDSHNDPRVDYDIEIPLTNWRD